MTPRGSVALCTLPPGWSWPVPFTVTSQGPAGCTMCPHQLAAGDLFARIPGGRLVCGQCWPGLAGRQIKVRAVVGDEYVLSDGESVDCSECSDGIPGGGVFVRRSPGGPAVCEACAAVWGSEALSGG